MKSLNPRFFSHSCYSYCNASFCMFKRTNKNNVPESPISARNVITHSKISRFY